MDFRQTIRDEIGKGQRGIEIGASYSPILPKSQGYQVYVVDHTDSESLRSKYSEQGVDVSRIEEVDAIDDGGEFSELDATREGFDFIVASHVFEHLTDPIHFLQRCERALKPDGKLYLLIPDRRFCFDYFRPVTTSGQVLDAYLAERKTHSAGALFDHHAYNAIRNGSHVWAEASGGDFKFGGTVHAGYEVATRGMDDYIDCHAWVFTPSSFRLIIEDIKSLGMISMGETFFHPSIGCEFFIVLSKAALHKSKDRLELAKSMLIEAKKYTVSTSAEQLLPNSDEEPDPTRTTYSTYIRKIPSNQTAIDLMRGAWVCAFPDELKVSAGDIALHDDQRIHWLLANIDTNKLQQLDVLELGPLEASHTAMLLNAGVRSVLAIEANPSAYLRCLITKEIRKLHNASFMLGDFRAYLEAEDRVWPVIVASGVLYHMADPLQLLEVLAKRTDQLYLWTHVVDDDAMPVNDARRAFITGEETITWYGADMTLYVRPYGAVSDLKFCGGMDSDPRWMGRASLIAALKLLGFSNIEIAHEDPDHSAGPALSILAKRT